MYKILIVEDDETIRNGIKTLLELQGYYVDIAVNGVDGLKKFDETYLNNLLLFFSFSSTFTSTFSFIHLHSPNNAVLLY